MWKLTSAIIHSKQVISCFKHKYWKKLVAISLLTNSVLFIIKVFTRLKIFETMVVVINK